MITFRRFQLAETEWYEDITVIIKIKESNHLNLGMYLFIRVAIFVKFDS
jgi:hypothetical protein